MISEDLEAKKHILVHNILEQIYTLFHENTKKGKKLEEKKNNLCKKKYRTNHVNE